MVKYFDQFRINDFFDQHDKESVDPDDARNFFNPTEKENFGDSIDHESDTSSMNAHHKKPLMKFHDTLEGFQDEKFYRKVAEKFDPQNDKIDHAILNNIMRLDFSPDQIT